MWNLPEIARRLLGIFGIIFAWALGLAFVAKFVAVPLFIWAATAVLPALLPLFLVIYAFRILLGFGKGKK